ncbi:MAG: hypothetical protein CL785_00125 [Chloroflexi bacterium]|nr:hypothetical protein [Chloroflexota bacterium]|tara:strand:- start:807 stop:2081 length:1275 start_codon:yes stop_codon:yes gene_type:complete
MKRFIYQNYGWWLVTGSILMNTYLSASFFIGLQVFFLPMVKEFGWSRSMTSIGFSLRQLETGFLAPIVGLLVDKIGPRKVIVASVLIVSAGMMLTSQVNSIGFFYLAVALGSIGASGASHGVSWASVVASWFDKYRGRALGFALMGPVFGAPLIIFVTLLEEVVGWRMATFLLGSGFLIFGTPIALSVRAKPEELGMLPDGKFIEKVIDPNNTDPKLDFNDLSLKSKDITIKQAIQTKLFWLLFTVFAVQGIAVSGLLAHQMPLFENRGFSSIEASATVTFLFVFSGFGRIIAGFILDYAPWKTVLAMALLGQAIAFLVLMIANNYFTAITFAATQGVSFGAIIASRPVLVGKLFGMESFASIQGFFQAATVGSGMVGPILFGSIFDLYGSYNIAALIISIMTFISIPLPYFSTKKITHESFIS